MKSNISTDMGGGRGGHVFAPMLGDVIASRLTKTFAEY